MNNDLLNPHTALIYTMVLMSAADSDMTDSELQRIGHMTQTLPVFAEFDPERLVAVTVDCADRLQDGGGLEAVLDIITASLPAKLSETAYAIACEVAAADLHIEQEEIRLLEMLRHNLGIDRLVAAGIERGVRARHTTL